MKALDAILFGDAESTDAGFVVASVALTLAASAALVWLLIALA